MPTYTCGKCGKRYNAIQDFGLCTQCDEEGWFEYP
jgi:hypothetical protein